MQSFFAKSLKRQMQADTAGGLYKQKAGMIQWNKPFSEKCREHRRVPWLPEQKGKGTGQMSTVIPFEKLYNTRDLGGMTGEGGRRIRSEKLIRSGHLFSASENDKKWLSGKIGLIIDFRNKQEAKEKADPVLPGADYVHLPIIQEMVTGITREEKSFGQIMTELLHNPDGALAYMEQVYTTFVTNDFAISQYAHFLELLLQERAGAILWHCTAGKDRAGFASILVQHLLGVSREDILEDYMMTNQCLVPEVEPLIAMIQKQVHDDSPQVRQVLEILFGARKEYLAALYEKIRERFGSFEAFEEQALGIDQEKRARLQAMYLEG